LPTGLNGGRGPCCSIRGTGATLSRDGKGGRKNLCALAVTKSGEAFSGGDGRCGIVFFIKQYGTSPNISTRRVGRKNRIAREKRKTIRQNRSIFQRFATVERKSRNRSEKPLKSESTRVRSPEEVISHSTVLKSLMDGSPVRGKGGDGTSKSG